MMLFYKAEGVILNHIVMEENDRQTQQKNARKIAVKSEAFHQKFACGSFLFVSDISDDIVTVGVITDCFTDISKSLSTYFKYVNLELKNIKIKEITFGSLYDLLSVADMQKYINADTEIMEKFGFNKIGGRDRRDFEFEENMLEEKNKKALIETADKCLMRESVLPEIERIFGGKTNSRVCGHPVHYMIQTDDSKTRKVVFQTLLQALYANGRISSRRYSVLNVRPGEAFSLSEYDALYNISTGGAVVIHYLAKENSEENGYAFSGNEAIENLCKTAKKYRNQVLTVFCLPRECKKIKRIFYENLETVTIIKLQEEFFDKERAADFLKILAKENKIRADKKLFAKLESGEAYFSPDLYNQFEEWYNNKLKTSVYPQYKGIAAVKQRVIKDEPSDSAYNKLQQMIGLSEAKQVIQKALNYYKVQYLYEERGLKKGHPAMHMVFTGNPGTAKTTTARLFARIMKENGLLSKGQLVEVGRGELVGRFVGWTAKIVQEKFRAAQGGVLFIDEAYSLVDDGNGSYGDEAINTIVQEMENRRGDVVVIFAGYPAQMEEFLQKNPGLRSRIAFHVSFADYNSKELCEIAELMGENNGFCFTAEAVDKLMAAFEVARKQNDFGNGRFVRNLIEQARMNQASRLLSIDSDEITNDDITTLQADDIEIPKIRAKTSEKIGFAC